MDDTILKSKLKSWGLYLELRKQDLRYDVASPAVIVVNDIVYFQPR